MKTLIIIAITLIIAVPALSLADGLGMKTYQEISTHSGHVTKMYDHDEGIVCYVMNGAYRGGISCIRD
jgi:hypothetical protein